MASLIGKILKISATALGGALLTLAVVFVMFLNSRQDLDLWHTANLDEEFTADSRVTDFAQYLALENRLFLQLEERVYRRAGEAGEDRLNRYKRGSLSDPNRWSPNWNRSYEMPQASPRASVLLLHGLSDSPYSLHHLAEQIHAAGAHVVGLRIPGHGTAPSGLVRVTWRDMAAAVNLAVRHLDRLNAGGPIYIVGYSNGAALAVHYALSTLKDPALPRVEGLVLISPEIGVPPAAAFAIWQSRLGRLLGLEKLAWTDILPEYDPFKYGSFAVNAADVSFQITAGIQHLLTDLSTTGHLEELPPIQAFSSVVDATVLAPALVESLFNRLPTPANELVLFDINRRLGIEYLLKWSPDDLLSALESAVNRSYAISLLTNRNPESPQVVERYWGPTSHEMVRETELSGLQWPKDVYSLSHVALPFPADDPLYGGFPADDGAGLHLGSLSLRGERGVLKISDSAMLRIRWNPFYPYLESRVLNFLNLRTKPMDKANPERP